MEVNNEGLSLTERREKSKKVVEDGRTIIQQKLARVDRTQTQVSSASLLPMPEYEDKVDTVVMKRLDSSIADGEEQSPVTSQHNNLPRTSITFQALTDASPDVTPQNKGKAHKAAEFHQQASSSKLGANPSLKKIHEKVMMMTNSNASGPRAFESKLKSTLKGTNDVVSNSAERNSKLVNTTSENDQRNKDLFMVVGNGKVSNQIGKVTTVTKATKKQTVTS